MYRRNRRALRAIAPVALAAAAAVAIPATASAAPKVSVHVRGRTLLVEGSRADDVIWLTSPADTPFAVTVAIGLEFKPVATVHRNRFDRVVVHGDDGNDLVIVDETPGSSVPFTDTIPTAIRGERGDDAIYGGSGREDLRGGPGTDFVDGNGGDDLIALGGGNDQAMSDLDDGNDAVDGGAGDDTIIVNGHEQNDTIAAMPDGGRARITRARDKAVLLTDGLETIDVITLGGSDFTELGDLSTTDVTMVEVDDGAIAGGDGPDTTIDTVLVTGTNKDDHVSLVGDVGLTQLSGASTSVNLVDMNTADALTIVSGTGADTIDATAYGTDAARLNHLTGGGNDTVIGGPGLDTVISGPGRDVVDGNKGDDNVTLDEGDDTFTWDPGDGSDLVDGGRGFDAMTFNGAAGNEVMEASGDFGRLLFTRDLGNIFMDTTRLEQLDVNPLGGDDTITIGDLSDSTIQIVDVNLAPALGTVGGDAAIDQLVVRGTPGDDVITAIGAAGAAQVRDLPWSIDIVNSEPTDVLIIDGNGGEDVVDTTGLAPDTIQPPAPQPAT